MTAALRIRPARRGDEARLCELFARVYGKPLSEERWRWKLGRFSASVPSVWLAEQDGAPVCQYAGMPAVVQLGDREVTAMVAVDAMTAPEHRRRGLLTQVVAEAHEAWKRAGIAFVLGLPNEQWGSRTAAVGFVPLFRLRWLMLPLRPGVILHRRFGALAALVLTPLATPWFRRRLRKHDPGTSIRPVASAGPELDGLWERLRGAASLSIRRDASWVAWRFLSAPDPGYRVLLLERGGVPVGWTAFRVARSASHAAGLIADLVGDPAAADWDAVIGATVAALDAEGAENALTLAAEGTARYRRLLQRGFLSRPHAFMLHVVVLDPALDVAALGRAEAWDMAGGDFDVI